MSATQWVGVGLAIILIAFIAFAFRQGMKVKPQDGNKRGGLPPGGESYTGDSYPPQS